MGAADFYVFQADEGGLDRSFSEAVMTAQGEHGFGGYSGTVAEKRSAVRIDGMTYTSVSGAMRRARHLIDEADPRVDDKYGPAGALEVRDEDRGHGWLIFGWAAE